MRLMEHLLMNREPMPAWLAEFDANAAFDRWQFFASRVVYYPGSGFDGHPVKLFGATHWAHCFVYVDYGVSAEALQLELAHPTYGFAGYKSLHRIPLRAQDLARDGWAAPLTIELSRRFEHRAFPSVAPFAFLEILERHADKDDTHGPSRLAILFLGADGIASYGALFCQQDDISPPHLVVIQDHGFGGNYDRFSNGGLLHQIATTHKALPEWLFVARNSTAWSGYQRVPELEGDPGGEHGQMRSLYRSVIRT
jgi:hypothetical protein